jgi:putative FmdB family regulatory protein
MPLYTFKCEICDTKIERLVKLEVNATICKECGGPDFKVLSVPSPAQWGCRKGF